MGNTAYRNDARGNSEVGAGLSCGGAASGGGVMKLSSFAQPAKPGAPIPPPRVSGRRLKIGALAFNKHIADELTSRLRDNADLIPGTPEQEAIWDFLLHGTTHGIVRACAGTGKTFTIIQGILRLQAEYGVDVTACTYNSFGWRACIRAFHPELDDMKVGRIVEEIAEDRYGKGNLGWQKWIEVTGGTKRLTSLCMNYLLDGRDAQALEDLADKHNVTLNGSTQYVYDLVPRVLAQCAHQTAVMGYDDQVWQTVTKRLPVETFDLLFVDECQDTNLAQQEMALMACPKGRIVFCGDPQQAIYGFRGADTESIPRMRDKLAGTERGVQVFPLTVTRRCPKSHVRLAQALVPEIQAMPDAPEGLVESLPSAQAARAMRPGDLVLCRANAPLVPLAYALIRANVKAVIRGRDIGNNLRQLIDKLRAGENILALMDKLSAYRQNELGKLARLGERGAYKVQALTDRCDCIVALTDGINNVAALKQKIDRIFADFDEAGKPKDAVVLGSVHRTKGLEASTVWVIAPELLPHPMAKQAWEREQERNLAYVAVTRAKYSGGMDGRIVFVQGPKSQGIPGIYGKVEA